MRALVVPPFPPPSSKTARTFSQPMVQLAQWASLTACVACRDSPLTASAPSKVDWRKLCAGSTPSRLKSRDVAHGAEHAVFLRGWAQARPTQYARVVVQSRLVRDLDGPPTADGDGLEPLRAHYPRLDRCGPPDAPRRWRRRRSGRGSRPRGRCRRRGRAPAAP